MKNKETGEFELLVGNGQIISGFFILALLLAVFFAMGFIVARAKYQQEPITMAGSASTTLAESRGSAAAPVATVAAPTVEPPVEAPKAAVETEPPPSNLAAEEPKPEKAVLAPEKLPGDVAEGTYWQVSAITNQDAARALQQTIKDMGLPVTLSQGPNKMIRVLVGPYSDMGNMAKVKIQLENAGLHPMKHTQ